LDRLLAPASVAVIGASDSPQSVGFAVLRNMLAAGFRGGLYPVNPKRDTVQGQRAWPSLAELPEVPQLAVICTPAFTVPTLIQQCGELGILGVVIISAGFREAGEDGRALEDQVLRIACTFPGMRILGPNCLGVIVPSLGLNASFAVGSPPPGRVAFVSQSGALGTSILDWAASRGLGLSHFVSVGNMSDVHFADLIDYFGQDDRVSALLLYIESIREARQFVSAARAFTNRKPIIAYKAGRFAASAAAAVSHTGALMGADDVHDAAFRRCGIERVYSIDELFDCAELLARVQPPKQGRLAIITNAGGPGVMATDALLAAEGQLAELSAETMEKLDAALPPCWSHGNPVDVLGDATPPRYADALGIALKDEGVNAALVILTPQAMTDPVETARAVAKAAARTDKPVLCAWLGGDSVRASRSILAEAGLPTYSTPERAIGGLMHLIDHARNIETLYETPLPAPPDMLFNPQRGRAVTEPLLAEPDNLLSEVDAKALLEAYGIPVAKTLPAADPDAAVARAQEIGYPVALKVLSEDITHKSDSGGVVLNLANEERVRRAFDQIMTDCRAAVPGAQIDGVTVQPMIRMPDAAELILGCTKDPVFGSVVLLGMGGTATEVLRDRVLALPPITEALASQMIRNLKSFPLLDGYRGQPRVDLKALADAVVRFSYLVADSPNLNECDINPLLVSPDGVMALDARATTDQSHPKPDARFSHLAIRPYPSHLQVCVQLDDGTPIDIRPIKPSDEAQWLAMLDRSSDDTIADRYFSTIRFSHETAVRYCFNDYDREIGLAALTMDDEPQMIGICRLVTDPAGRRATFTVFVEDRYQDKAVDAALTRYGITVARQRELEELTLRTRPGNERLLDVLREQGFHVTRPDGGEVAVAELQLTAESVGT
jgi:acetyltransferase